MKNFSGRKRSRRRHHSHRGVDDEQNYVQTSEEGESSHQARRHRHHHKKRHRHRREAGDSDDEQDVDTEHKHHAIKISEDNSMGALVRASGSNQGNSTAVSDISSYATNVEYDMDDHVTFKEWIPHFIKHYGYGSLVMFK